MPSLLTVLAHIPWRQVVESAPKIAQGAGRLWETVKSRRNPGPPPEATPAADAPTEMQQLHARTAALEAQVQALQEEMRTSAQLVKDLAEQNALLVARIELMHRRVQRTLWLGAVSLVALGLGLASVWLLRG